MNKNILIFIGVGILIAGLGIGSFFFLIPRCPESCDDGNPCTQDFCSPETNYQCENSPIIGTTEGCQDLVETCKQYQCLEGECQIVTLPNCCGNGECETGEDWETCPQDCELCNDGNPCTQDIYSYKTDRCSYVKLDGKQPGCSAKITCGSQICKTGVCQIEYVSDCCGNKICESEEAYEICSADCPNCDDKNECTIDEYDYHKHECVNTPILDVICCGNGVCETGETYEKCSKDCPNCDDKDECTEDSFDYEQHKCVNKKIIPCCGNGKCEVSETYKECADDCVKSGVLNEDEVWGGEILITGDVYMDKNLKILPGTVVKFAVQDDQQDGWETPADGYNNLDPTRLISYGKTHSSLMVGGKLTAAGTLNNKILFTSASENPKIADWEGIYPQGDGSLIEYSIIEWSRGGICAGSDTPNSIFRNNIIRYTMWGAISGGWSGSQSYNNEIYECGHQGIAADGGDAIIEDNTIYDCHGGIVVCRGSAVVRNNLMKNVGFGIHIGGDSTPTIENNHIEIAPHDSKKEWCYEDFCYPMFGEPVDTPILTEVYKENNLPRYAVPAYRIENKDHRANLPLEAEEWLAYGWKNDKWNKINVRITATKCEFPSGYSMYVLIPNPTQEEKDAEIFNDKHSDIYKIMAI